MLQVTQDGGFKRDHDWSLLVYYNNPYKAHVIRESGDRSATGIMKDDVIMVNLFPEVPLDSYSNKNEIIFIVDRSGKGLKSFCSTAYKYKITLPILT